MDGNGKERASFFNLPRCWIGTIDNLQLFYCAPGCPGFHLQSSRNIDSIFKGQHNHPTKVTYMNNSTGLDQKEDACGTPETIDNGTRAAGGGREPSCGENPG
jgi:hypothetical protein